MTNRTDVGLEAIEFLYALLQIDDEWSVREERGFTWWAGDFAQRVWAEPCVVDHGIVVSRVAAETRLVTNARNDAGLKDRFVLAQTARPSLTARIWDGNGTIRLLATTRVFDGAVEHCSRLLSLAIIMQITDAQYAGPNIADMTGGQAAISAHPYSGRRPSPDEMLTFVEKIVIPTGAASLPWPADDFARARESLDTLGCLAGTSSKTSLTAEFPFYRDARSVVMSPKAVEASRLEISTAATHPVFGHGLSARLSLPLTNARTSQALEFNLLEFETHPLGVLLGGWGLSRAGAPQSSRLTFSAFYPNITAKPGLIVHIATMMALRAQWAAQFWAARYSCASAMVH